MHATTKATFLQKLRPHDEVYCYSQGYSDEICNNLLLTMLGHLHVCIKW